MKNNDVSPLDNIHAELNFKDLQEGFDLSKFGDKDLFRDSLKKYPRALSRILQDIRQEKFKTLTIDLPNHSGTLKFSKGKIKVLVEYHTIDKQKSNKNFTHLLQELYEEIQKESKLKQRQTFSDKAFKIDEFEY